MIALKDLQKIIPKPCALLRCEIENHKCTMTFNLKTAIYFKRKGYKVIAWGIEYKGAKLYVFDKKPINIKDLPF